MTGRKISISVFSLSYSKFENVVLGSADPLLNKRIEENNESFHNPFYEHII